MAVLIKRNRLSIWRDVIFALFIREIKTGFNDKFGISWAVISPVIFIVGLSAMRGLTDGAKIHGMPTFVFMFYGMVYIQLFLSLMEKPAASLQKNRPLFAFRQVQPISAFFATALFETMVKSSVITVIFILMYLAQIKTHIDLPLELIATFFLLALTAVSVGMIFAILQGFVKEISKIRSILTKPLFFISGVFFSLQDLPKEAWPYLTWNPILQAIELARGSAYQSYGYAGVSFTYLSIISISCFFLALSIYIISWKKVISA